MAERHRPPAAVLSDAVREYFRQQGARGGAIGGKRRFAAMTAEERRKLAQKAAKARWGKKR